MIASWKTNTLIATVIISAVILLVVEPTPQDLAYHQFADVKNIWGIPNFWGVASNLPFLFVGLWGLWISVKRFSWLSPWNLFFAGVIWVTFGSGYYHWSPSNATLVWDRLPMAVSFMALFSILLSDYVDDKLGKRLLWPLVTLGVFSVCYWQFTDDLRLYLWVQFFPIVCILLMYFLFEGKVINKKTLLMVFIFYISAKLAEAIDIFIYQWLNEWMSGHAIKHVLAAGAPGYLAYNLSLFVNKEEKL